MASLEDLELFKAGVQYIHVQEHHFDSSVKRMTVVYQDLQDQTVFAFMKGAPECVLDVCIYDAEGNPITDDGKTEILHMLNCFTSEGLVFSSGCCVG